MSTARLRTGELDLPGHRYGTRWDGSLDWALLIHLAQREGATPSVYTALLGARKASPDIDVDDEALQVLARLRFAHALRLGELQRRVSRLAEECRSASIPILLLKGSALVHALGLKPVERPMGDVDVLVHPDHSSTVWAIAHDMGWSRKAGRYEEEVYNEHHHLPPLVDTSGLHLGLEIHTELFQEENPFPFSARDLWQAAEPLEGLDGALRPSWQHLFIHNALHFAWSHGMGYGTWKALRDTGLLLSHPDLQPEETVDTARRAKATSALWWTLHLAEEWAQIPVNPSWKRALGAPPTPASLLPMVRRHLAEMFIPPSLSPRPPVRVQHLMWEAAIRPGRSGHGRIRPWARSEEWKSKAGDGNVTSDEIPDSSSPPSNPAGNEDALRERLLHRMRRAGNTAGYIKHLLGG